MLMILYLFLPFTNRDILCVFFHFFQFNFMIFLHLDFYSKNFSQLLFHYYYFYVILIYLMISFVLLENIKLIIWTIKDIIRFILSYKFKHLFIKTVKFSINLLKIIFFFLILSLNYF